MADAQAMTIPEQAVQAALDKWRDHELDGTLDNPRMRAALTAAAPYMSGVKVKQLEWREKDNDAYAHSDVGYYEINETRLGFCVYRNTFLVSKDMFETLEAAKAAGQANYEKRVLSALEPSAAREQALEEAAQIAELHEGKPCRPAIAWTEDQRQFYESGQLDASSSIATAIRALKSQPVPQTGDGE